MNFIVCGGLHLKTYHLMINTIVQYSWVQSHPTIWTKKKIQIYSMEMKHRPTPFYTMYFYFFISIHLMHFHDSDRIKF